MHRRRINVVGLARICVGLVAAVTLVTGTGSAKQPEGLEAKEHERKHRQRMLAEGHGSSFIFVNEHGGWWRRSHFHDQSFKPLLKAASLPKIRFHDLRHTSATLLLTENVHAKVVQERLGHSKISTTLDTYSHVLPTMQQTASVRFDEMFKNVPTS